MDVREILENALGMFQVTHVHSEIRDALKEMDKTEATPPVAAAPTPDAPTGAMYSQPRPVDAQLDVAEKSMWPTPAAALRDAGEPECAHRQLRPGLFDDTSIYCVMCGVAVGTKITAEGLRELRDSLAAPQAAVPESPKCRGNDPFCPCQDGDLCHYEGENPMAVPESPMPNSENSTELERAKTSLQTIRVSFTNDCYLQQALQEIVRANPHFAVEVVAVPDSQDGFIAFDVL